MPAIAGNGLVAPLVRRAAGEEGTVFPGEPVRSSVTSRACLQEPLEASERSQQRERSGADLASVLPIYQGERCLHAGLASRNQQLSAPLGRQRAQRRSPHLLGWGMHQTLSLLEQMAVSRRLTGQM